MCNRAIEINIEFDTKVLMSLQRSPEQNIIARAIHSWLMLLSKHKCNCGQNLIITVIDSLINKIYIVMYIYIIRDVINDIIYCCTSGYAMCAPTVCLLYGQLVIINKLTTWYKV